MKGRGRDLIPSDELNVVVLPNPPRGPPPPDSEGDYGADAPGLPPERASEGADNGEGAAAKAPLLVWYGAEPPPPLPYLVEKTLPEIGVAIIAGQWSAGKTFVGADLARAVMTGGGFVGRKVERRGGVLWFAAEGEDEIEGRVRAAVENGEDRRDLSRSPGRLAAFRR